MGKVGITGQRTFYYDIFGWEDIWFPPSGAHHGGSLETKIPLSPCIVPSVSPHRLGRTKRVGERRNRETSDDTGADRLSKVIFSNTLAGTCRPNGPWPEERLDGRRGRHSLGCFTECRWGRRERKNGHCPTAARLLHLAYVTWASFMSLSSEDKTWQSANPFVAPRVFESTAGVKFEIVVGHLTRLPRVQSSQPSFLWGGVRVADGDTRGKERDGQ